MGQRAGQPRIGFSSSFNSKSAAAFDWGREGVVMRIRVGYEYPPFIVILGCPRMNVAYQFLGEIQWLETFNRFYLVNETITGSATCQKCQMLISFVRNPVF
eukprot:sb/3478522/